MTQHEIDNTFQNSILKDYIKRVVSNRPLKDVILNSTMKLQIFDGMNDITNIEAIDKSKIDYIILATKLCTMIEVLSQLKLDNNVVMVDELEKEIERFKDTISESIKITNNELIDKDNGKR